MSNKKRISKKISTSKHHELKDLENRNFFLRLENAHLRAQIAMIATQPHKTDYPSDAPEYLNRKNDYQIAKETNGPEIYIDRSEELNFNKYEASWIEEFKNNPDHKKPFLKYLLDRFNLEVPIPDQFKRN